MNKIQSFLLLALLFSSYILTNASYSLVPEKFEWETDPTVIQNLMIKVEKNTRGEVILNVTGTVMIDLPPQTKLRIRVFETKDFVTFKLYGRAMEYNICFFIKTDTANYPQLQAKSNLPNRCPITPDSYYIADYIMPTNKLPPMPRNMKLKVVIDIFETDKNFLTATGFGRIDSNDRLGVPKLPMF